MRRALNLLRQSPHYRRESFDIGLRAAGFQVFVVRGTTETLAAPRVAGIPLSARIMG